MNCKKLGIFEKLVLIGFFRGKLFFFDVESPHSDQDNIESKMAGKFLKIKLSSFEFKKIIDTSAS